MDWITLKKDEVENDRMPPICVHCGAAATGRHNQTRSWHPPWVQHLYWLAVLPGVIARSIMTREMRLSLPVCDAHHPDNKRSAGWSGLQRAILLILLWLAFIPLGMGIAWLMLVPPPPPGELATLHAKAAQLREEVAALATKLKRAGYEDTDLERGGAATEAMDHVTNEMISKHRQAKREFSELQGRIHHREAIARQESREASERRIALSLVAGGPLGAAAGFLVMTCVAFFWRKPPAVPPLKKVKPLVVREITADGISLVGVDVAFVKAVIAQRQR